MVKYFFLSLSLIIFVTLSLVFWYWWGTKPVSSSTTKVSFVVAKDETGNSIIQRLHQASLIKSEAVSKIYLRLNDLSTRLKPGGYVLTPNLSTAQVFTVLTSGPKDVWVTIPEGWRREQIADRIQTIIPNFNAKEFMQLTQRLEGQLFPDTYLIPTQAAPSDVVKILQANFSKKSGLNPDLPQDREILILASLIEREAKADPDRQLIAGILTKRLEANWPLQVDASVQYAANRADPWWQPISDTKYPSLYNTYLYPGLPPGPICNPGLASITAARTPQTSPYWYYLTGTDGVTRYARDLAEHNSNIDKYLRL